MPPESSQKILKVVIDNSNENAVQKISNRARIDYSDHKFYENRELSHLKFNFRVLTQAKNKTHPLLERLMFLLIFSSNLDEFYEIRVSGLQKEVGFGRPKLGPDGILPEQLLKI